MADQFGNLGTLSPEDYAQQQQINRQQKMAEMLMAQNQQPQGQMVSGRYVAPSFFQNLQPIANMLTGAYMAKQGDVQAAKLAEAIRGRNATEAQDIIQTLQGTPDYKAAVPYPTKPVISEGSDMLDNQQVTMPVVQNQIGKAPDKQAALMKALKSTSPVGQMVANSLISKSLEGPKEFNLGIGETRYRVNPDNTTTEIAAGKNKEHELSTDIKTALALNPNLPRNPDNWTPQDAQIAAQTIAQHKKLSAPNMTSITNVQAFEPLANKLQGKMGEGLYENYQTLKNIPTQIKTLEKAALLAPKSFAGSLAEQKLATVKFFNNNLGTNISAEKVGNTEELRSALFTNVMENLKKMDASPSQQQQQILQQSMGSIGTDPNSIPRIVNVYKEILTDKALQHNLQVKQAQEGPAKLNYAYDISVPLNQPNIPPKLPTNNVQKVDPKVFQFMTPEQQALFSNQGQ